MTPVQRKVSAVNFALSISAQWGDSPGTLAKPASERWFRFYGSFSTVQSSLLLLIRLAACNPSVMCVALIVQVMPHQRDSDPLMRGFKLFQRTCYYK